MVAHLGGVVVQWGGVVVQWGGGVSMGGVVPQFGRRGGLMVARQTVVLQSRVRIRRLPSSQLTANLLVGCHLGCHLAVG